jgi:hypothetical protein
MPELLRESSSLGEGTVEFRRRMLPKSAELKGSSRLSSQVIG